MMPNDHLRYHSAAKQVQSSPVRHQRVHCSTADGFPGPLAGMGDGCSILCCRHTVTGIRRPIGCKVTTSSRPQTSRAVWIKTRNSKYILRTAMMRHGEHLRRPGGPLHWKRRKPPADWQTATMATAPIHGDPAAHLRAKWRIATSEGPRPVLHVRHCSHGGL